MRVIELGAFGRAHLRCVERPDPQPGPGQVVIELQAASLNYRDLMMVEGSYNPRQALPLVPLSDGVGRVIAVGDGVSRVALGDRVSPIFAQRWFAGDPTRDELRTTLGGPLDGTLAERMLLSAEGVVKVPECLTDEQAACLPCAALTAWSALVTHGELKPGATLLTQGTGGVSLFALQIAKLLNARVIVTSKSDEKLERAKSLGADEVINYERDRDWGKTAHRLAGEGVDQVIEVGGKGTLESALRAVRPGGIVSIIGVLSGAKAELNVLPILMQNVRLQGIIVGHRNGFEALLRAVAQAKLQPVIDRVFGFSQAAEAMAYMAEGRHFGKICLNFSA